MSFYNAVKAFVDAPVDESILGRALIRENRLGLIISKAGAALYYVFTRGGLLAAGGALALGSYYIGVDTGREDGFMAGCRASIATPICDYAEHTGNRLRRLRTSAPDDDPHKPLPPSRPLTAEQQN